MKSKFKKQKRAKNKFTKECMITLAVYVAAILILPVIVFIILAIGIPKDVAETLATVMICIWFLVIFGGAIAVIFFSLPWLRKRQAMRNMKEYDFTHCDIGEEERFYCEAASAEYVFKEGVFDTDEEMSFEDMDEAAQYIVQFGYDNLIYDRPLGKINGAEPDLRFINFKSKTVCRTGNGRTTITLYYINEIIIKSDGSVTINGETPPGLARRWHTNESVTDENATEPSESTTVNDETPPELVTQIYATFRGINANARIVFFCGDDCLGDMKFSARAVAALRAGGIKITNEDLCDFILNTPKEAFKKIARKPYKVLYTP